MKSALVASLSAILFLAMNAPALGQKTTGTNCNKLSLVADVLTFSGEIQEGDAGCVQRSILASAHVVSMIAFNSAGGDPFEALKIADVLNKYFVAFATGECDVIGDHPTCMAMFSGDSCASACSLIFLTANDRSGTEVFLHRPTFTAAVFSQMSAAKAEVTYNGATERLLKGLRQRGVPESEIELIMSIPSSGVQQIAQHYPENSAWMAEWLSAQCPTPGHADPNGDPLAAIFQNTSCTTDALTKAQKHAQNKR